MIENISSTSVNRVAVCPIVIFRRKRCFTSFIVPVKIKKEGNQLISQDDTNEYKTKKNGYERIDYLLQILHHDSSASILRRQVWPSPIGKASH